MENTIDFDGVFRFTNWTDADFSGFWNNKEYLFRAGTCSPMILSDETLENIQEIRKRWAHQLATREWYKGKDFAKLNKAGGMHPATYDEKLLEPMIEKCLNPLPMAKLTVKTRKGDSEKNYKSKAISDSDNPNFMFSSESDPKSPEFNGRIVGKLPDAAM